jgi:broad specificity phosphatase PhoE
LSLLLVRHGQASAGTDDYDRLSERGVLQARRLGDWLADTGHRFDAILTGGMRRHQQTYDGIAAAYAERDLPLPEPATDTGLAEFDHHAVFDNFASGHGDHPAVIASRSGGLPALGALVHAALGAWAEDRIADVPETWAAFGDRVAAASKRLQALPARGNVLVLSSGGVISRLAQQALGANERTAVDLNLSLRNSGICTFHLRPYGLALDGWNALPHLHDARDLWTYY